MAELNPSTLRPGFLVALKTNIYGGAKYSKKTKRDEKLDDGTSILEWETRRTIRNEEAYKLAVKARQNARNLIADVCINSGFGLLCPLADRERLQTAIDEARVVVRDFNKTSNSCQIRVYVMAGYIADNDTEALRSIAAEVRDLISDMENGVENLNAKTIRDAASRALKVGQMLSPEANEQVQEAVKLARAAARKVNKASESAAAEVDTLAIKAIAAKRTAFLDLTGVEDVVDIKGTGRALDLTMEAPAEAPKHKGRVRNVDMKAPEAASLPKKTGKRVRLPDAA